MSAVLEQAQAALDVRDLEVGGAQGPLAARLYLAGTLPNTPENLVRWIRDPKGVKPETAMPVTGISDEEARDVAAYLLSR